MSGQDQYQPAQLPIKSEAVGNSKPELSSKREFVEPEISQPVDVLEATTFFQALESGGTG